MFDGDGLIGLAAFGRHVLRIRHTEVEDSSEACVTHAVIAGEVGSFRGGKGLEAGKTFHPTKRAAVSKTAQVRVGASYCFSGTLVLGPLMTEPKMLEGRFCLPDVLECPEIDCALSRVFGL